MSRFIAVVVLVVVTFAGVSPAQVATAGLVGNWKMEGSGTVVPDQSGMGNSGDIIGDAALISDPDFGSVLHVFGESGAMVIPHHACLEPATGTIEVWLRMDLLTNADIIAKTTDRMLRSGAAGGSVYGLRINRKGSPFAFIANDDHFFWEFVYARHGRQIAAGEWYLVSMRWDGDFISIFVDGRLIKATRYESIPGIGLSYYNGSPLYIAVPTMWGRNRGDHFYGRIARVRVYDRSLSDDEISAGFAADAPASKR